MLDGELAELLFGVAVGVERVDLRGRGGVFVSDGLVRDAGVGECHAQAAMAERRRDGFETHPPIDRLCRERVTQLVGVHVIEPGVAGDRSITEKNTRRSETVAITVFGRHLAATNSTYRPTRSPALAGPDTHSNNDIQ